VINAKSNSVTHARMHARTHARIFNLALCVYPSLSLFPSFSLFLSLATTIRIRAIIVSSKSGRLCSDNDQRTRHLLCPKIFPLPAFVSLDNGKSCSRHLQSQIRAITIGHRDGRTRGDANRPEDAREIALTHSLDGGRRAAGGFISFRMSPETPPSLRRNG